MTGRVLVLGDDSRSCLTVVRSLGRKGVEVTLGVQDPDSIVPYSRFVKSVIRFPSSSSETEAWVARLIAALDERPYELVIPTSDNTLVPIVRNRSELEHRTKFAIPDDTGFIHSYQKHHTFSMAAQLEVPIPRTRLLETSDDLERLAQDEGLCFPLIVKPGSSKVWKGSRKHDLHVRVARNRGELKRLCEPLLDLTPVLVQDFFQGIGVGQEFLAQDGVVLRAFQHERVHEPMGGGGSSYRKSVPVDTRMLSCSERLLSRLKWTGVAMVEYKLDPGSGKFVLMEINGRFWGSLPLAVAAGADFPWELYCLLVEGKLPAVRDPKTEIYCRNLLTDLSWFRSNWAADRADPMLISRSRRESVTDMVHLLRPRDHLDTMPLDDPRPGLVEGARIFTSVARRGFDLVKKRALRGAVRQSGWRRRELARLGDVLALDRRMLFICKGNICRSPFAAAYAQRRLADLGMTGMAVSSAGTLPYGDRPSPDNARDVSREFGVELDAHLSAVLTEQEIRAGGAIFCMDYKNYTDLLKMYPEAKPRLFFLRPFESGARNFEISDPWNQSAEVFRACYRQIASSVDALIEVLRR